jgi:hypothetical protein
VLAQAREAEGARLPDQLTQEPMTAREGPDPLAGFRVDPDEDESLELTLVRIQDAKRRVPGTRQISRGVQDVVEDRFEVELSHERPANLEEALKLLGPQAS